MPSYLEGLIIFALILNIAAFALYSISLKAKKIKAAKTEGLQVAEANQTELEKEVELHTPLETEQLDELVEELKQIESEPEAEILEEKEEKAEEKPYEVEFVEDIKAEIEEADKISEPFDLIEGMDEESKFKDENEISYSIDVEEKPVEKEEVKGERLEAKREIMDSVNIFEVEGEDEPEDIDDEFVVRHYEPLVYQHNMEEQEDTKEESVIVEEDEEDEIEKRIAYLTGEWTEDYVIQPKKGKDIKK